MSVLKINLQTELQRLFVNLSLEASYLRKGRPMKQGQLVDVFHYARSFVNPPIRLCEKIQ